jgi:hypothetical protein
VVSITWALAADWWLFSIRTANHDNRFETRAAARVRWSASDSPKGKPRAHWRASAGDPSTGTILKLLILFRN